MVKIRIIQGSCGISYVDENGNKRFEVKSEKNAPFSYDSKKAERLVRLGVAEYVREEKEAPPWKAEDAGEEAEETNNREAMLGNMTNKELLQLASSMGIDVSKCKVKKNYVDAILAAEADEEDGEEEDEEDGEEEDEEEDEENGEKQNGAAGTLGGEDGASEETVNPEEGQKAASGEGNNLPD